MPSFSGFCNEISRCCYDFYHAPFTKRNLLIGGGILLGIILIIIIIAVSTRGGGSDKPPDGKYVIVNNPLIDGCNNFATNIKNLAQNQLEKVNLTDFILQFPNCKTCQTDFQLLKSGFVSTQIWVAEADCKSQYKDAVALTLEQIDVIKRFITDPTNKMTLVTNQAELMATFNHKQTGGMISVRGGHSIDSRLAVLRMYYDLGVRFMSLQVHDCPVPWLKNNLTSFGKDVIKEMNRLGMVIDMTGLDYGIQKAVLDASTAPVIFSHSNAFSLTDHPNNIKDDILISLKNKQSLVMLSVDPSQLKLVNEKNQSMEDFVKHLNYITKQTSVSQVGIGSNFDNFTGRIKDLKDVSTFPDLFHRLGTKHPNDSISWSQGDLKKLAGENIMNFLKLVEQVKKKGESDKPKDTLEDLSDFDSKDLQCYSEVNQSKPIVTVTPSPETTTLSTPITTKNSTI